METAGEVLMSLGWLVAVLGILMLPSVTSRVAATGDAQAVTRLSLGYFLTVAALSMTGLGLVAVAAA